MKKLILLMFISNPLFAAAPTCVKNVVAQWKNLKSHPKVINVENRESIFRKNSYTMRVRNKLGIDNHFQGVQRLPGNNNFVVSGGDIKIRRADLFVIMGGKFNKRINLDMWPYWHPGGIQIYEKILAVSVEEWKESKVGKVYFYDFSTPDDPKALKIWIDLPHRKAGAVAFNRLPDGRYILATHNQDDMEIYYSITSDIKDGFPEKADLVIKKEHVKDLVKADFLMGSQGFNIIRQCDNKLFIAAFNNHGKVTPLFNDKDLGELFSLDLSGDIPKVEFVAEKHFICKRKCNMAAAGGISINEKGELSVLGSHHFRRARKKNYYVAEFGQKKN